MENFQLSVPEAGAATRVSVILPVTGLYTIRINYTQKINQSGSNMEKNKVFSTIRMDHNKENVELHLYILSEKDKLEIIPARSG